MQDQKIGKRCTLAECRQIDWMPIECKYCNVVFCSEHFKTESHNCQAVDKYFKKVLVCPFCEESFKQDLNYSEEDNLAIHQAAKCKGKIIKKESFCHQPKCKQKLSDLNSYCCKGCTSKYCLKHRLREDHGCLIKSHWVMPFYTS